MKKIYKKMLSLFIAVLFVVGLSIPVFAHHSGTLTDGMTSSDFYQSYFIYDEEFSCTGADDFFSSHSAPVRQYTNRTGEYVGFADLLVQSGYSYDDLGYFTLVYYRSDTRFTLYQFAFTNKDKVKEIVFNSSDRQVYFNFVDGFDGTLYFVSSSASFDSSSSGKFIYGGGSSDYFVHDYIPGVINHTLSYYDLSSNVIGISSSHKVVDQNNDSIYTAPSPGEFIVTYDPVLSDSMISDSGSPVDKIKVTVSLSDASKDYCINSGNFYTFIPYVSSSPYDSGLCASFDNAVAVSGSKSYYLDFYTHDAFQDDVLVDSDASEEARKPVLRQNQDICYGWNVSYSLNRDNDFTCSVVFDIPSTGIKSNTDYYFYVLACECNLLVSSKFNYYPVRPYFRSLYENSLELGLSGGSSYQSYSDLIDFYLADCSKFNLSKVSKKTSADNFPSDGLYNELFKTPSTLSPNGKGSLTFDQVDDYNAEQEAIQREEFHIDYQDKSFGFDLSSLDSLFNSCKDFFSFLKQGFSIFPNWIWYLIASVIVVLIFLRIMGR